MCVNCHFQLFLLLLQLNLINRLTKYFYIKFIFASSLPSKNTLKF